MNARDPRRWSTLGQNEHRLERPNQAFFPPPQPGVRQRPPRYPRPESSRPQSNHQGFSSPISQPNRPGDYQQYHGHSGGSMPAQIPPPGGMEQGGTPSPVCSQYQSNGQQWGANQHFTNSSHADVPSSQFAAYHHGNSQEYTPGYPADGHANYTNRPEQYSQKPGTGPPPFNQAPPTGYSAQYNPYQNQIPLPVLNQEKAQTIPGQSFPSQGDVMVQKTGGNSVGFEEETIEQKDQKWLNSWLESKGINQRKKRGAVKMNVQIPVIRSLLRRSFVLLDELKTLKSSLCDGMEGDEDTWNEQKTRALHLQHELETIRVKLDEDTIGALEDKLKKRKEKREWRKKRHAVLTQEHEERLVRRKQLDEKIDADMAAKRQKVVDALKEKEMKANADKILAEVRKKLLDGNKSLGLLKSLRKLRQIRKDSAVRKGFFTPPEQDKTFEKQTTDLMEMMERQKKIYEDEEKTLQVILEMEHHQNLEKEREQMKTREEQKIRKKQNRNLELIFGKEGIPDETDPLRPFFNYYTQAESSYQALLHIRRDWDSFIVPDQVIGGTFVPQGWVVPPEPSDDIWASALKDKR